MTETAIFTVICSATVPEQTQLSGSVLEMGGERYFVGPALYRISGDKTGWIDPKDWPEGFDLSEDVNTSVMISQGLAPEDS